MPMPSSTRETGDAAPDFTLPAANRPQSLSLNQLLAAGPLVIEFLRGTW
jgi:peroxiredoxin